MRSLSLDDDPEDILSRNLTGEAVLSGNREIWRFLTLEWGQIRSRTGVSYPFTSTP